MKSLKKLPRYREMITSDCEIVREIEFKFLYEI